MEKIAAPIFLVIQIQSRYTFPSNKYIDIAAFQVLILVVNLVRYFYTSGWHSSGHWADMFLLQPCSILIPLVPLLLPLAWLTMNAFGLAWILALFYTARQYKVLLDWLDRFCNYQLVIELKLMVNFQMSNDPFEDADVTDVPLTHSTFSMKCQETRAYFVDTLLGRGKSPFRTENLLQTLASVTVGFLCVDKLLYLLYIQIWLLFHLINRRCAALIRRAFYRGRIRLLRRCSFWGTPSSLLVQLKCVQFLHLIRVVPAPAVARIVLVTPKWKQQDTRGHPSEVHIHYLTLVIGRDKWQTC